MSSFADRIRPHVDAELDAAQEAERRSACRIAFSHLERAHVLGQRSTVQHVRVHWRMLLWGLRHKRVGECVGQALRIVGAATKTFVGLVPHGNTGGSDVGPFRSLPICDELDAVIRRARAGR